MTTQPITSTGVVAPATASNILESLQVLTTIAAAKPPEALLPPQQISPQLPQPVPSQQSQQLQELAAHIMKTYFERQQQHTDVVDSASAVGLTSHKTADFLAAAATMAAMAAMSPGDAVQPPTSTPTAAPAPAVYSAIPAAPSQAPQGVVWMDPRFLEDVSFFNLSSCYYHLSG